MITKSKLKAIVIGLGKAGSRFDEENRPIIWSHVGAYLKFSDQVEIVAGIDPDKNNRILFEKRVKKEISYSNISDIGIKDIDIISIATPYSQRLNIFEEIISNKIFPKVIICEKPLSQSSTERQKIKILCEEHNIKLLVHYNRRFLEVYKKLKKIIHSSEFGRIFSITIKTPNRFWSIGSHAVDLILFLTDEKPLTYKSLEIPSLRENGEKALDFLCNFPSGIVGRIITQGLSNILIFEVEVVGTKARAFTKLNGEELIVEKFITSNQYENYLIPGEIEHQIFLNNSSFEAIIKNSLDLINLESKSISSVNTASISEEIIDKVYKDYLIS